MDKLNSNQAFKKLWIAMRILGLDPPQKYKLAYYVYSIFLNFVITFCYPLSMVINMFLLDTKKSIISNLTLSITVVICSIKTANNYLSHKELHNFRDRLKQLDLNVKHQNQKDYFEYLVKASFRFFLIYTSMYGLVAATCEFPVIFATERRLLYPAWFPWDWKNSTNIYIILHIYQIVGIYIEIYQNILNDLLPGTLLWMVKGHLHILGLRIKRIGYDTRLSDKENYQELVDCIKNHKICLELYHLCQSIISRVMILQFIGTELTLCATAIYVFFVGDNFIEIVYLFCYFISNIMEMTLCCYCGSELLDESQQFTTALYECNWMEQNLKFRKCLIMFMQQTQKPWAVVAGGVVRVTLGTWLSVLKSTYSLFAVLNQLT